VSPRGKTGKNSSQHRPTILDVARRANVSKSLVSMVTRGETGVSDEKRQAILDAIDELGYRPNLMARSLVQRQSRIFGVMISDLRNPFFGSVVSGVQDRARELGYQVLFNTGERDPELEEAAVESMLQLRVDGLILASPRIDDAAVARAAAVVPIVLINRETDDRTIDTVNNDNIHGVRLAVEHLADLGHRRIALISGGAGAAARARERGYRRAMDELGLEAHILVAEGSHTEEGGERGARELLVTQPFPTAIFASNDLCAIGAMNALEEAGLTIPADVSLVGFDNTRLAALRHISLTSVNQPGRHMGRSAVDRLTERIASKRNAVRHDVVTPSLVVRSTTARPRAETTLG
jgi:DNA-binding LacI/PurR family transcriptional regulator